MTKLVARTVARTFLCISLSLTGALVPDAPAQAQTDAEAACRAVVAKAVGLHAKKTMKALAKCHAKRAKGRVGLAVDCNDLAQADPSDTLGRLASKLSGRIQAGCTAAGPGLLAQWPRCPSPGQTSDDGGATEGIDDYAELASCMIALVEGIVPQVAREALGRPKAKPGSSLAKCQKKIGKAAIKLMNAVIKERARCQAARDASGEGLDYGCVDADPRGKIARARAKFDGTIAKSCNIDDDPALPLLRELDALDACGDTVEQLQRCIGEIAALRSASGMAAMAYELPGTCTAGRMRRTLRSGAGNQFTDTVLSTGWTGTSHLVDVLDGSAETVFLSCDDDCANCTLNLDVRKGEPDGICRCAFDPTITCDTFNGPDIDDCGLLNNQCDCNFGAALALSSGGVPVCVLNRHTIDLSDTSLDVGTGQQQGTVTDTATVHLGENTQLEPCPICDGDTTPNDGLKEGTCTRGPRVGLACDVNAVHPDFGPSSFDCPPNSLTNVSGTGLFLVEPFASFPQSLPFTLPCDDPPGTLCPCLTCSGDTLVGCSSDEQCEEIGAGTCSVSGGAGASPNACTDGVCTDGACLAGPSETFCDGIVRKNGRGFLECNTDADCAALDAGSCSIEQLRPCFNDPLEIDGEATMFTADLSAIFCIPPTNSAAVNNSAGLPGAGAVTLSVEVTTFCASDPTVVWEPPGGSNCP